MLIWLHLSPVMLVMVTLMVLRRPPVQAAIAGTALVAVLWLVGAADAWQADTLIAAGRDTAVLFLWYLKEFPSQWPGTK